MATQTPNLGLNKSADGEFGWGTQLRQNQDTLDQAVGAQHNLDGTHKAISATTIAVKGDIFVAGKSLRNELAAAATAQADRIAAEAAALAANTDRIAAEAAWTAALAANPSLNPQVHMNPSAVTADLSIPAYYNAYASGPLEVGAGVQINIGLNASLNII